MCTLPLLYTHIRVLSLNGVSWCTQWYLVFSCIYLVKGPDQEVSHELILANAVRLCHFVDPVNQRLRDQKRFSLHFIWVFNLPRFFRLCFQTLLNLRLP